MQPGQAVDRYIVEEELGRGGMAVVYRVRHATLDSIHALKLLHTDRPAVADRLVQEGKLQASLRHPNVVAVTDVVVVDGAPGLVIEYLPDGALDEFAVEMLSEDEVRELFVGICSGVAHAHSLDMVHRDLKPGNVLLQKVDGKLVPKVADFGLAKALHGGADEGPGLTRTGVAMGTPAYMAPEQVRDAKHVDARADVWALGVILFELLAGRRLFLGESSLDVMNAVVAGPRMDEISLLPDWAEPVVRAALLPRDQRPENAGTLLRVLAGEAHTPADPSPGSPDQTFDFSADPPPSDASPDTRHPTPDTSDQTFDFSAEPPPTPPEPAPGTRHPTPDTPETPDTPDPPSRLRLLALLVPLLLAFTGALEPLDTLLHFPLVRATQGEVAADDVVVMGFSDQADVRAMRAQHPAVIDALVQAGATAIVFDMVFGAKDDEDRAMAEAARRAEAAGVPVISARTFRDGAVTPLGSKSLDRSMHGGLVEVQKDLLFGTVRRVRVRRRLPKGASLWNVSALAVSAHMRADEPRVEGRKLVVGGLRNPVSADVAWLSPAQRPQRIRYGTDVAAAKGRMVFIGLASGPRDLVRTPDGPRYGVEVLASFAQTLQRQATLRAATPEQDTLAAGISGFGVALAGSLIERRLQPGALVVAVGVLAVGMALATSGFLLSLTAPLVAGLIGLWAVRGRS